VEIGTRIGAAMLAKLRTDLIAIMDVGKHEDERVHQPDHSRRAMDPSLFVGSPPPSTSHVRTRLYFTSESHIYSLFNVLRWGTSTGKAILSAAGQSRLTDVELGYLTHIVFRVLAKRPPRKPAKPSGRGLASSPRECPRGPPSGERRRRDGPRRVQSECVQ